MSGLPTRRAGCANTTRPVAMKHITTSHPAPSSPSTGFPRSIGPSSLPHAAAVACSVDGKCFRAILVLLMSTARQEELSELLEAVLDLKPVKDLAPVRRLRRVHYDWLEAGKVAQRTVARLSEQLRRYL